MINDFRGEYRFLSNFHECHVNYGGLSYTSSEAAFQAQKAPNLAARLRFATMEPVVAKKEGKLLALPPNWDHEKLYIMSEIVRAKFAQNGTLRTMLTSTIPHDLVEGNWWHDDFWGTCNCGGKKPGCGIGNGKNWLGRILMAERAYWINLMWQKVA
jgi:ribA/ribD-fused uncharacterized protein